MPTVTASFEIDSWDQDPLGHAAGRDFARASVTKTFRGDVEGTSTAWLVMSMTGEEGQEYVALETFDVTVLGSRGTFVLLHQAAADPDLCRWTIAPGSGTGDLVGIAGDATVARHDDGSHTLELRLADAPS